MYVFFACEFWPVVQAIDRCETGIEYLRRLIEVGRMLKTALTPEELNQVLRFVDGSYDSSDGIPQQLQIDVNIDARLQVGRDNDLRD